ncbi:MAG: nucleotide-binding protein [Bacteroidales bacterium]|nr:nucleotide-binding protein [Bacteroidales bacterium]
MKPRIFIGSSYESLQVAERIKDYFSGDYDCHLWSDDIFKSNESFMDTLMKSASLFDFGIMIFAKDDSAIVRGKEFDIPRDNMLFEYGLFLGRVGIDRAFIVVEKDTKLPSDLFGITHVYYETEKSAVGTVIPTKDFEGELSKLKKQMDESINLGHLGLLPSTVTAISYFDNFVKLTADWIVSNMPNITFDGNEYSKAKLLIKLPDSLDADIKDSATVFYKKHGLKDSTIETRHRHYPIHFESKCGDGTLEIYDMPTVIHGLNKAIDLYFKKGHIGKKTEQQLAEDNEMSNFRRVLNILIQQDAMCRECVEIID